MESSEQVRIMLKKVLHEIMVCYKNLFLCYEIWEYWGFPTQYQKFKKMATVRMEFCDKITERILALGGIPEIAATAPIQGIMDVEPQFKEMLLLEQELLKSYDELIDLCFEEGENGTRICIEKFYPETERDICWLEKQITHIKRIGIVAYIS